jgi:hypothetical protein
MSNENPARYQVNQNDLPDLFPTHEHEAAFWESLGRAVATFGFLEEVLGKAIFAFTATRAYDENEIEQAYANWLSKLEHALIDPLGSLIDTYGRAVKDKPDAVVGNFDELLDDLRQAAQVRNILCHGSWRLPNESGASVPFFVNRRRQIVDTAMNQKFIDQVQQHTVNLICAVINTVTQMGWQFPGSIGPGKPVWEITTQQSTAPDERK